jgi:hypothetical protein
MIGVHETDIHREAREGREWMRQWRQAARALALVRAEESWNADLASIAEQLEDACMASLAVKPPGSSSGLVQQQRTFHRKPRA